MGYIKSKTLNEKISEKRNRKNVFFIHLILPLLFLVSENNEKLNNKNKLNLYENKIFNVMIMKSNIQVIRFDL